MTLDHLLQLARAHLGEGTMESSARLCLIDAVEAKDAGELYRAYRHATYSLRYSVGVFHKDYEDAVRTFISPRFDSPAPRAPVGGAS